MTKRTGTIDDHQYLVVEHLNLPIFNEWRASAKRAGAGMKPLRLIARKCVSPAID